MTEKETDLLSKGFDSGNYSNSYVSEDFQVAWKAEKPETWTPTEPFAIGFILGFFASYENHEIPFTYIDDFRWSYHSDAGQSCVAAGYCEDRPNLF